MAERDRVTGAKARGPLILGAAILLAAAGLLWLSDRPSGGARTNVLLITLDTTRLDDLAIYGGPAETPHLQALRDDGVLFHHMYSVAFGTTPSHASLFTSSHARSHGVYNNRTVLARELDTLAEVMASQGARTGAFVSSVAVRRELGFEQGFERFDQDFSGSQRRGGQTVKRFAAWLGRSDGLFFAWIHFMEPHTPYTPRHRYGRRYLPADEGFHHQGSYRRFNELLEPGTLLRQGREVFAEHERLARGLYRAEISLMDRQIGRAVEALKRRGLYDRTLIAVVADHGENFGVPDPLLAFGHAALHQHVVRLPMLIKMPDSREAGSSHHFLAASVDIAPTLLDALGLDTGPSWEGRSMLPAMERRSARFRDHVVLESAHETEVSVRTQRWVYRRRMGTNPRYPHLPPLRFHDLATDPAESRDVSRPLSPEGQEAFRRLETIADEFLARKRGESGLALETPSHLEALRALGYVE